MDETDVQPENETDIPAATEIETVIPPLPSNKTEACTVGEFPCDECEFVAKNKLGLAKHKSARHGYVSAKKQKKLDNTVQPHNNLELIGENELRPPNHNGLVENPIHNDDLTREEELSALKILEKKFGPKLNYKSGCSENTPLAKIKHEKKVILDLINSKCSTEMVYKSILGISSTLEIASQHHRVKPIMDLRGLHTQYAEDKDEIMESVEEILSQHPGIIKQLSPEVKLALILSSGAVSCAAKNKKKVQVAPLQNSNQPVLSIAEGA